MLLSVEQRQAYDTKIQELEKKLLKAQEGKVDTSETITELTIENKKLKKENEELVGREAFLSERNEEVENSLQSLKDDTEEKEYMLLKLKDELNQKRQ